MAPDYDAIASSYESDMKLLPQERPIDYHFSKVVGDVSGYRVLDLAAGTGWSARMLLAQGAKQVVGLDISAEMVAKAKEDTKNDPRLQYEVADCKEPLSFKNEFDMVTGAWLLPFAANKEELTQMWRNIAQALKPGGRYVGITSNVKREVNGERFTNPKYGLTTDYVERIPHGFKVRANMHTQPPIQFFAYSLHPDLYASCGHEVGLVDVRLEEPTWETLPPDLDRGWWQDFLDNPSYLIVTAKFPEKSQP